MNTNKFIQETVSIPSFHQLEIASPKSYVTQFFAHRVSYLSQIQKQYKFALNSNYQDLSLVSSHYDSDPSDLLFKTAKSKIEQIKTKLERLALSIEAADPKQIKNLSKALKKSDKEIAFIVRKMNLEATGNLAIKGLDKDHKSLALIKKLQEGGLTAQLIQLLGRAFKINHYQVAVGLFKSSAMKFSNETKENINFPLSTIEKHRISTNFSSIKFNNRASTAVTKSFNKIQILFNVKTIEKQLASYHVQSLSQLSRVPILRSLNANDSAIDVSFIPLNQYFDEHFSQVKTAAFSELAGISGISTTNRQEAHMVNGWLSQAKTSSHTPSQRIIYSATRHAILSDKLEKNEELRKKNSLQAAKEIVQSILIQELALQHKTLEQAYNLQKPITLNVSSLSLVTPDDFRFFTNGQTSEKQMLKDHMEAWEALKGVSELEIEGKKVKINLQVAAFNYGVNEGAVRLKLGTTYQQAYNVKAIEVLEEHFKDLNNALNENLELLELPVKENILLLQKQLESLKKEIINLSKSSTTYLTEGNQYELTAKIINFYNMMNELVTEFNEDKNINDQLHLSGFHSCLNCMSGKDRTGIADSMAKAFAIMYAKNETFPTHEQLMHDQEIRKQFKAILETILLEGGGFEINQINTGVPGYKVGKEALRGIFFESLEDSSKLLTNLKGLSGLTSA